MSERFAHLHVHSDYSLLAGCGTMEQYAKVAQERGHPGIAFTEFGSMRGTSELIQIAKKHELKPVFGIEFYVCGDMTRRGLTPDEKAEITKGLPRSRSKQAIETYEREHGIQDRLLLTVWAKTNAGLQNLFKLSSRSWNGGFYYKPRIDLSALIEHGEGLMVGTGCADSLIHAPAREGRRRRALAVADRLWEAFGPERLWLEVMPHELYNQALANRFTLDLKARWGAKARLLATQDAHYVNEGDDVYQRMLAAIGERGDRSKPLDDCGLPGAGWWMKTRQEMKQGFRANHSMSKRDIREALDNTVACVAEVETTLGFDKFQYIIPDIRVPAEYVGPYAYMKALCLRGWVWRDIPARIEAYARAKRISVDKARGIYEARLLKELRALKRQKFVAYILFVREVYEWVRSQDIACGPGRGSAAGSIVNYLLGITSVDPVEHTLLFERFISPNRIDMPDIDMDFEDVRRGEIIAHLRQKYGEDCTSQIATVGKLKGKACIRDVSRVLKVPIRAVSSVTASLLERSSGDERASMTIVDSFREIGVCKAFNAEYPKVLEYARHIEGYSKSLGIHAAGVVCAPRPLEEILPMESRDHDGVRVPVTAVDFSGAEGFGLLKLDVLGLRTITVLRLAADEIRRRHGVDVVFETLPLDDPEVLQGFTDHDYAGIFQYDSASADKICSGVGFTHFRDIAAMTALNRPGTARSGLAGHYVARKKNPELMKKAAFHPSVSKITADTLGIIVYQEHVIEIFIAVAGFEPGTADSLRKRIAKKEGDMTLGKERENFVAGAMKKTGMSEAEAGKIMDAITFFGCLPTDSHVLVPDASWRTALRAQSSCPIQALTPNRRIWSVDETGSLVENRVKRVWHTGVQDLYEVVTDQGSIRATAGHHWQLNSGEYVETRFLNRGSLICYLEADHDRKKPLLEMQVGEESATRAPDAERDGAFLRKVLRGDHSAATVREVKKVPVQEQTWDIEVAEEPHNYVVLGAPLTIPGPLGPECRPRPGFVCHNSYGFNRSHAVSYGMVAYWCMWLKKRYPLEFYRALLYCEPKYERIQSVAKDAKAHDIEVLPADVSVSGQGFTIDDKLKAIRGSLVDIKGVGEKAARSIMDNQPFVSFWDFLERIDGRAVNKRAVLALALAGALDELLPNVKWFADHIEEIWKLKGRKTKVEALKVILARSGESPDYDPEERALVAATVSPLAFGKHPMDAYDDFLAANVPIKIESMGSEDFWLRIGKEKVAGFWICGIIIEIRMNQVGDFHSGAPPSDDEKKRMRWGEQYVNINIEDASGKQCRCKFDWDIFEEYRSIVIDRGRGTPVIVHVTGDSHYQNLLAHGCVDLEQLRKNILAEKKLELWERIVTGRHPLKAYKFKTSERRKLSRVSLAKVRRVAAAEAVKAGRGEVVVFRIFGMITHVRRKLDKKMKMMGFFGILGIRGYLDVLCFGSLWPSIQKEIQPGRLVEMEVEYNRGQGIYSGDLLRFLE